jgi:hypothetical protein
MKEFKIIVAILNNLQENDLCTFFRQLQIQAEFRYTAGGNYSKVEHCSSD